MMFCAIDVNDAYYFIRGRICLVLVRAVRLLDGDFSC